MICIHFRATNDVNGNPRRCYAIINNKGDWKAVLDEGYEGIQVVRTWAKETRNTVHDAGQVDVPTAQYQRLLALGITLAEDHKSLTNAKHERRRAVYERK